MSPPVSEPTQSRVSLLEPVLLVREVVHFLSGVRCLYVCHLTCFFPLSVLEPVSFLCLSLNLCFPISENLSVCLSYCLSMDIFLSVPVYLYVCLLAFLKPSFSPTLFIGTDLPLSSSVRLSVHPCIFQSVLISVRVCGRMSPIYAHVTLPQSSWTVT